MLDGLLLAGAALRLTRVATTDDLGAIVLREPLANAPIPPRLADGAGCPFCVGFWVSLATVGSYSLASRRSPATLHLWRVVAAALTVNYVTAHVSSRLD